MRREVLRIRGERNAFWASDTAAARTPAGRREVYVRNAPGDTVDEVGQRKGEHSHDEGHSQEEHSHEGHSHGVSEGGGNVRALSIVLVLTTTFLIAEIVGGLLTGSLALIADAGHMASDSASIGLALFAFWLSRQARHAQGRARPQAR
ncbi:MAG: cation transporter [Rubrobacteraceae bacterium]|nr:cation transporter [Rubrobacteraceae bacterium]